MTSVDERLPAWPDLLATALVGTDRRQLDLPTTVSTVDTAAGLLEVAALLAVSRRAGARPTPPEPVEVSTAPPETAVPTLPAATRRLAGLVAARLGFGGDGFDAATRADLLAEWLRLAAERGWRVPPELLPDLLDVARGTPPLRALVAGVGGARAGWLAAQHPGWSFLLREAVEPAFDPVAWTDGTIGQRVGFLAEERRRAPAEALARLVGSWPGEPPDDRVALIGALRTGLGPADEDFLEAALDDRRREVHALAAGLLASLPTTRFGRRMAERATAAVRPRGGSLVVDPPAECDPVMRRAGVAPKPPSGIGERAWWLEEVVARTPLSTWVPGYAAGPAEFLALSTSEGWAEVLHRGLARAAVAQRDTGWASALLDRGQPKPTTWDRDGMLLGQLFGAVPAPDRADRAVALLRAGAPAADQVLELVPAPWPAELAAAVCTDVVGMAGLAKAAWRVRERLRLAAVRMPADATSLDRVAELALSIADTPYVSAVGDLADTLRFRYEMTEELR